MSTNVTGEIYSALYTQQLQKKAKTWHDGYLKASGGEIILYDQDWKRLVGSPRASSGIKKLLQEDEFRVAQYLVSNLEPLEPGAIPDQKTNENHHGHHRSRPQPSSPEETSSATEIVSVLGKLSGQPDVEVTFTSQIRKRAKAFSDGFFRVKGETGILLDERRFALEKISLKDIKGDVDETLYLKRHWVNIDLPPAYRPKPRCRPGKYANPSSTIGMSQQSVAASQWRGGEDLKNVLFGAPSQPPTDDCDERTIDDDSSALTVAGTSQGKAFTDEATDEFSWGDLPDHLENDEMGFLIDAVPTPKKQPSNAIPSSPLAKKAKLVQPSIKKFVTPFKKRDPWSGIQFTNKLVCEIGDPPQYHFVIQFDRNMPVPKRRMTIPTAFWSMEDYNSFWIKALQEHVQVSLLDKARRFKSRGASGFHVHTDCRLRQGGEGHFQVDGTWYLVLGSKQPNCTYSKHDIWAISKSRSFEQDCVIARAQWHGVAADKSLLIDIIGGERPLEPGENLFAMPILPTMDLMVLDFLYAGFHEEDFLQRLINSEHVDPSEVELPVLENDAWKEMKEYQSLNEHQKAVIIETIKSVQSGQTPVSLVHGPFGTGKSLTIAVLIMAIQIAFPEATVLFSSNANVAVDTVLLKLVNMEWKKFVRTGSLKAMNHRMLPYAVQYRKTEDLEAVKKIHMKSAIADGREVELANAIEVLKTRDPSTAIEKAFLIGTTCMSCTSPLLVDKDFTVIILDEATQVTEPTALMALRLGCQHLVCVGDPKQLPPTVETKGSGRGIDVSMYQRLLETGKYPVKKLRVQYRCHPAISRIPNELFYNRELVDGTTPTPGGGVEFIDIKDGFEEANGCRNRREGDELVSLVHQYLCQGYSEEDLGVISFFRLQVQYIKEQLESVAPLVKVATVDSFQGGERVVIFLSAVRTRGVTFISDPQRLNVALTRARHKLVIVGHRTTLCRSELWSSVIGMSGIVQ